MSRHTIRVAALLAGLLLVIATLDTPPSLAQAPTAGVFAITNARIIDARRHPLACCFSGFKQHFARGQHFSYDLEEIGRYYRDYVRLMAHFDAVLPGRFSL